MKIPRYEIRFGKWGAYFYDLLENKDLTLKEVENLLNELNINKLEILGKALCPPER